MAASTASQIRKTRTPDQWAALILEAARTYKGSFAKLNGPSHGTSAHQGRVEDLDTDNGSIPFGIFDKSGTAGNTVTTSPAGVDGDESEGITQVVGLQPYILEAIAVTGASAQTDVGKIVYKTNNNDLTLTRPSLGSPAGIIIYYYSSTSFDVFMFSAEGSVICNLAGSGKYLWHLGTVSTEGSAAGNLITGLTAPHHGKFLSCYAVAITAQSDANVHMDIELEIGGTNVTGGTMTLDFADAQGDKKAGTTITAGNVFHEGDLIDVESLAAGFVAGTAETGFYNVYALVEVLPGI